jgi:hypothetical protein
MRARSLAPGLIALTVVVLAPGTSAEADDGLRCGQWLVTRGAAESEVAAKCGLPTDTYTEHRSWRTRYQTFRMTPMTIDRWTYDRGPNEFVRTLEFHDGILADVAVGAWGTPQ